MIYRAIGALLSAELSVVLVEFHENAGQWSYDLKANNSYGKKNINSSIQKFIEEKGLQYKVALITVHNDVAGEQFNGAFVAAETGLPVITDIASLDKELGGNGNFYSACLEKLKMNDSDNTGLNKTICVAFMGVLRWREEYNFLSSVTGARRSSIGGAIWLGQEA